MKVIATDKAAACKHTRFICEDCGSMVYKEKPGPKGFNKKKFLALARRVRKTFAEGVQP